MNKYEISNKIEKFAPLDTQEKWDCSGWIVDIKDKTDINKVMYTLTVTDDIINQAINQNCDMIISHHPLFYVPLNYKCINIYCAHTNMDKAEGGTTDVLIENLGFKKTRNEDFVRVVELDTPTTLGELRKKLIEISPNLRYINNSNRNDDYTIKTIGFCAGSGSEFINTTNTDAFVTGDLKFHTALESKQIVFDIGHFESEIFIKNVFKKIVNIENGVFADEKSPFI